MNGFLGSKLNESCIFISKKSLGSRVIELPDIDGFMSGHQFGRIDETDQFKP